jgi:hypothetical protein
MRKLAIPILAVMVLNAWALAAYAAEPFDTALRHYHSGQYEKAIQVLKEYVETTPDPDAYYTIGYAYYNLGKHEEANKYFGYAFMIDPEFTPSSIFRVPEGVTPKVPAPKPRAATAAPAKKAPPMAKTETATAAPAEVAEEPKPMKQAAAPAPVKEAPAAKPSPSESAIQPEVAEPEPEPAPAPAEPETPAPTPAPAPAPRPPVAVAPEEAGSDLMDMLVPAGIVLAVYLVLTLIIFLVARKRGVSKLWLSFIPVVQLAALVMAFKGAKKTGAKTAASNMGAPDLAMGGDDPFADLASESPEGGKGKAGGGEFDDFNPFDDAGGAGDQGEFDPFKEDDEFK